MPSQKLSSPWSYTPSDLVRGLFFHGSIEPWSDRQVVPGRADGCFWAADNALIAQTYIAPWYGSASIQIDNGQLKQNVRPDPGFAWDVAQQLGARAQVLERDRIGRASSWRIDVPVTYQQVVDHLKSLGYTSTLSSHFSAWINTSTQDGQSIAVPARARPFGRLILIDPLPHLRVADLSCGEGDLTDPQHLKLGQIQNALRSGADCVKIDDFCQSPTWGNVEHPAWGFSQSSMDAHWRAGHVRPICATHRDWINLGDANELITEDVLDWHFGQVVHAITVGHAVSPEVIWAHAERFERLLDQEPQSPVVFPVTLDSHQFGFAPSTPDKVRAIAQRLAQGQAPTDQTCFALRSSGKLAGSGLNPLLEACVVQAAREQGRLVPVNAIFMDKYDRPLRTMQLHQRLDQILDQAPTQDQADCPSRQTMGA
ncbi:hypothetical protein [Pusillimonas sp. T2]|uniref:hypothetical protein n=1 Tax=Pusillimonas sp. T2 TaxID=1548123 RepID=UPI00117B60C2|nr:hypothetical protein [Pusillimonas sp. T2]